VTQRTVAVYRTHQECIPDHLTPYRRGGYVDRLKAVVYFFSDIN